MNRSMFAALVVALMLGSGAAGYLIGRPGETIDRAPPSKTATSTPATPPGPTPSTTPPAQQPTTPAANPARPTQPAAPVEPFGYRRVGVDSSQPEGEACLFFNKPLVTGDSVKYGDYFKIAPEVKSAVRVVDDKLCIAGLAYGQDYTITLREGLPAAADGGKLAFDRTVDVSLGARPAVVSLPGKGFILPRGTAAGLPINTINVNKVGIAVYRVNERGLSRFSADRYSSTFPGNQPLTESYELSSWLNGSNGALLWKGEMDIKTVLNQPVLTGFPIRETVKEWKPGAYFVVAWNAAMPPPGLGDNDDWEASGATGMWVIDTDIALTTFAGRDGLTVFARSLQSAQPIEGLEVALLSRGNEILAKAVTTADGRANFAGGLMAGHGAVQPVAVLATDTAKQEFSRLELGKSAFDLSDRGIDGREQPGPVDAFLYTERGVYRPGETVQLVAMLRDDGATALANMPVTLVVTRPDGSEFTRYAATLGASGALHQAVEIPKSSRRGRWAASAYIDPRGQAVGRVEFSVEDFVPEKLKVELASDQESLRAATANGFTISADFLYGAPASELNVESDIRVTVDPRPFPAFAKYSFGLEAAREKFEPPLITLQPPATDEKGKSRVEWRPDKVKDTALPLRVEMQARVFEPGGGRATKTDKSLPLRTRDVYLGVRPTFEGRYAREGTDTEFELIAVDGTGKRIERAGVQITVEHLSTSYQWYQVDGRWRWQTITSERPVATETATLKADQPFKLAKSLQWGRHRLTVTDPKGDTSTSLTFYVGWWGGSAAEDAPDTLRVASDRANYAPGDKAKVRIEAAFAGEALIAIATDRVLETYTARISPDGTTVEVPVKAEWGPGAYALVTAWRPLSASGGDRTPARSIGAVWLGLDPGLRTLKVELAAPEKMTPRQRVEIPVRVANAQGPEAYVTLAAVDEGILQLTKYKTPNPADFYFGKRRLAIAMRDDYGRLLDARADEMGRIRSGGDAGDIGGLDIVPTKIVSLFSGPVKLDDKGEAKIAFDMPDFIGQVRLMAVAYDKNKVGSAEARLFVRDAVTADVVLPRFLAPGDTGRLALSLHNVEGQPGDYQVKLETSGAVSLERPVEETRNLPANKRELLTWPLKAGEAGLAKVAVAVQGPGGFSVRREWEMQVRAAQTPSAIDTVARLEPGRELTVDRDLVAGFVEGSAQVSLALSHVPGIDVAALLRSLDKYPYGCIEQTTSRALPLLYYNDVALLGYGPADAKISSRVQEAIYRIIDMQMSDGSFGMWGPFSSPAAEWLQAYALDFLLQARAQQMAVPAAPLQRGLTWLNRSADKLSPNAQAYAWYVLAKAGLADPGRVRYFQDKSVADIKGGLAWAQLAAALNLVGEPGRARLAFATARQRLDERDHTDYYGSPLRDRAALLALASEAGGREGLTAVMGSLRERLTAKVEETTTQEKAWLVLAARTLGGGGEIAYALDGTSAKSKVDPVVVNPDKAAIARGLRLKNEGDSAVWLQVTARGVPRDPQPAATNGLSVVRRYYKLDGKAADLGAMRQNDRLVVSIAGRNIEGGYHEVALLDLLPAGFEIESVLTEETAKPFPFLGKLSATRIAEGRDDRFFASFNLGTRPFTMWWDDEGKFGNTYHVAYIVRAVTPGSFALPAANVSDMYAPRFFGRTAMGQVAIEPR